jgi:hypothetical protein
MDTRNYHLNDTKGVRYSEIYYCKNAIVLCNVRTRHTPEFTKVDAIKRRKEKEQNPKSSFFERRHRR